MQDFVPGMWLVHGARTILGKVGRISATIGWRSRGTGMSFKNLTGNARKR